MQNNLNIQTNSKERVFTLQKRNVIALCVWCTLLVLLIAGITVNAVKYQKGIIDASAVYRRLFYALLCFVMMSSVYLVEHIFRTRFSLPLEIALSCFAFLSLAGGTVYNLYVVIPIWDKILHSLSGPLFSLVGIEIATVLLKNQPQGARKAAAAVVIAFLFALAVGYLWEIFEYTVDSVIPGYDNQRWKAGILEQLSDGTYIVSDRRGTALIDTMSDMICNFIGSFIFLLILLFVLLKNPQRLSLFDMTPVPRKKTMHTPKQTEKPTQTVQTEESDNSETP